tara:strand:+ start:465 stop:731 length:267 start_codon:yes stop_codon:yes gene_type:complete
MIKIELTIFCFLLLSNILIHYVFEKQERNIDRLLKEKEILKTEINLVKINLSFLKRQENLKKINAEKFNLQPYDILDIIYLNNGIKDE